MIDAKTLKQQAEHVEYELWMFDETTDRLNQICQQNEKQDTVLQNVFLESFGIHARNLIDFFSSIPGSRGENFVAKHFVRSLPEWEKAFNKYRADLKAIKEKVNTLIAHLTPKRIDLQGYKWEINQIAETIHTVHTLFLQHRPSSSQVLLPTPPANPKWAVEATVASTAHGHGSVRKI